MKRMFLLACLFLIACSSGQASSPTEISAEPTGYIAPSYPTAQAAIQSPNQTVNGIIVTAEKAWMDGKNVNANICYTLPDGSDWSIWSANLNYAGNVLDVYGTTLLSFKDSADGLPGIRCDTLTFVVAPDADLSDAVIMIDSIGATPREGEYCTVFMPKIQQTLLERGIGITLDCEENNGVQTMKITGFPPEMSQAQAEEIVYNDEFFTIKGPWVFSFNLAQ